MKELIRGAILAQNNWRSQIGRGDPGPLNQNATNDKNLSKQPCFFIFSFFEHLCVHQYMRTTITKNNKY